MGQKPALEITIGALCWIVVGMLLTLLAVTDLNVLPPAAFHFIQEAYGQFGADPSATAISSETYPPFVTSLINDLNVTGAFLEGNVIVDRNDVTGLHTIVMFSTDDYNNTQLQQQEGTVRTIVDQNGMFELSLYDFLQDGRLVLILSELSASTTTAGGGGNDRTTTTSSSTNNNNNTTSTATTTGTTTTLVPPSAIDSDNDGLADSVDPPTTTAAATNSSNSSRINTITTGLGGGFNSPPPISPPPLQPQQPINNSTTDNNNYSRTYTAATGNDIGDLFDRIAYQINHDANIPMAYKRAILDTIAIDLGNRQFDLEAERYEKSHRGHEIWTCWYSLVLHVNLLPNFRFNYNVDVPCDESGPFVYPPVDADNATTNEPITPTFPSITGGSVVGEGDTDIPPLPPTEEENPPTPPPPPSEEDNNNDEDTTTETNEPSRSDEGEDGGDDSTRSAETNNEEDEPSSTSDTAESE